MSANTLFLRLEGPLQSWGVQESKFVIRRTIEAPTKSGVIGLLCAAMGIPRKEASDKWLPELSGLCMGVRIDRPGIRWWDYHTIGARMEMPTAEGKSKLGPILTRREYLCDASFLVVLQGNPVLIQQISDSLIKPVWTLYLGRKCCPPSRSILEHPATEFPDIISALQSIPYHSRFAKDELPENVECIIDWQPHGEQPEAPPDAEIWYDVPVSFDPPSHIPRFVIRGGFTIGANGQVNVESAIQHETPRPLRPRANYTNSQYNKVRKERLQDDKYLCVFCKAPATTVQHITYRNAGGNETKDQLRSLCRLCHDAVTMIEYGLGMGMDRINPEEEKWRKVIIEKRKEIINFRSLETRRRHLDPQEVE